MRGAGLIKDVTKKLLLTLALGVALASSALPQESQTPSQPAKEESPGDSMLIWEWANFIILAGVLGYLIKKSVPPLFRKQSDEIQAALAEAAKIKHEAAAYASSIEMRLANLQREIEDLRTAAHAEMTAEGERIRRETEHHVLRIREQSAQEVQLMTRGAKDELRRFAAELAVGMASDRIRTRITPALQEKLAGEFIADLHRRGSGPAAKN
jgi:F-type H+-transporting ATPase subunit b